MKKDLLFWLTVLPLSTVVFIIGKITGSKSIYFPIIELILFTIQISSFLFIIYRSKKELKKLQQELFEENERYQENIRRINQDTFKMNNKIKP